ncbi:helix-turn-helix transcriptional regulator [Leucobacter sp. VD1]|uniref:helix-turn-helix transcriptional regulator n=1 Tax=Leucobacter sp. VD1 TaxID=3080381 RepID=UPI003FA5F52C
MTDLAELLGMSESTIYRKRSLGEPLPKAIKINSAVRWTRESVEEFLAEHAE